METQVYKVRDPAGNVREIRGPAGATDEQIITQAARLFGSPDQPAPAPAAPAAPARPAGVRQEYPSTTMGVDMAAGAVGGTSGFAGGAALGALGGPFAPVTVPVGALLGSLAGSGLATGIAREGQQLIDRFSGAAGPETAGQMASRVGGNIYEGVVSEGIGRGLAPVVSRGVNALAAGAGRLMDLGRSSRIAAGNILREAAGNRLPAITNALATAPAGSTPAQAIVGAGVRAPVVQTILSRLPGRLPAGVNATDDIAARQRAEDLAALTALAGGGTATEVRVGARGAQEALNNQLGPARENALANANQGSDIILGLRQGAAALRQKAADAVGTVRRLTQTPPEASLPRGTPAILGGDVPPTPTVTDRALGNTASQVPGQARISNRYTYPGQLADLAIRKADEAAKASLDFGVAAQAREAALADLAANGIRQPLQIAPLQARIAAKLKDPQYAGLDVMEAALKRISDDFAKWADSRGVIDAQALDALRKNSINAAVAQMRPNLDAKAQAKLAAGITGKFTKVVRDAIEEAGGAGYGKYLDDYSEGMRKISESKMGGELLRRYKENPDAFLRLVRGDDPKAVEKIFGSGNIDIAKQLSPDALKAVRGVASRVATNQEIAAQVSKGETAYEQLLRENTSLRRVPNTLNVAAAAGNRVLAELESRLGAKVTRILSEAALDGIKLKEAIELVPAPDRNRVLRALRTIGANPEMGRTVGRFVGLNALAEEPEVIQ